MPGFPPRPHTRPWTPDRITGLCADLDPTRATVVSGAASALVDAVAGYSYAQGTTANRPVYTSRNTSLGGFASLDFNGVNQYLKTATATEYLRNKPGATFYMVANVLSLAATGWPFWLSYHADESASTRLSLELSSAPSAIALINVTDVAASQNTLSQVATTGVHLYEITVDCATRTATARIDANTAQTTSSLTVASAFPNTTELSAVLGSYPAGSALFANFELGRLLMWPRLLTAAERAPVRAYLTRYGVTA